MELKSMLATNTPADPAEGDMSVWSPQDYERYRALLRQTGVNRVIQDGDEVRFQIAGPPSPSARESYRIAVAWTAVTPEPLVSKLSEFRKTRGARDHAYQALGDGWYIWIAR